MLRSGQRLLKEKYVLLCLSARAITEAAQDQARHAEGIPYELETFTQLGVVTDLSEVLDPRGKGWQPKIEGKPVVHRQEFPEDNAVVSFRVGESPRPMSTRPPELLASAAAATTT